MFRTTLLMDQPAVEAAITLECRLLDPAVRSDKRQVEELLASDFTEIGSSGRLYSRDEVMDSIGGFASSWGASAVASDMEGRILADDLVLVTYVTDSVSGYSRRSSIWRHLFTRWQLVFHQGTALPHGGLTPVGVAVRSTPVG